MVRDDRNRTSGVESGPGTSDGDGGPWSRDPPDDPRQYLRDDMTLADFERTVEECSSILEIQRKTRMPRWKVKRLLHHTDLGEDLVSTAQQVAALRDDDEAY